MKHILNNGYTHFEFEPAWPLENDNGKQALPFCEIHELKSAKGNEIVIVTSSHNREGDNLNHNLSITNGIEKIATRLFKLGVMWTHFIEHYPKRGDNFGFSETFDLVTFSDGPNDIFIKPQWKHLDRNEFLRLIGKRFPDYYDKDAWDKL